MFQYSDYTNSGSRDINEDSVGIAAYEESYCFVVADGLVSFLLMPVQRLY